MSKGFQFPLQNVLRIKQQQQQQAEMKLSRMRHELDAARNRMTDLEHKLATAADEFAEQVVQPNENKFSFMHKHYVERLRDEIAVTAKAVQRYRSELDQALSERNAIAIEVEALQTLKAAELRDFQDRQNQQSLKFVDEHVMRSWTADASQGVDD